MNTTQTIEQPPRLNSVTAQAVPEPGSAQQEVTRLLAQPARRTGAMAVSAAEAPVLVPSPSAAVGRVLEVPSEGRITLRLSDGRIILALTATSCLLRPLPGDLASLLLHGEKAWVTAILERAASLPMRIDLGPAALEIRAAAITIESTDLHLAARKLSTHAVVSVTACEDRYANVAGTDSTHARCTLFKTSGHMGLHAGDTSITAEALIKVDAGQVHMC